MSRKYKDRRYTGVSAAASPWIPVNAHGSPFELSYFIQFTGVGQVSAAIEGTHDNIQALTSGAETSGRSIFVVTALASTSAGANNRGVITEPFAAIRYNTQVVSGAINVVFSLLQSGN